MAASAYSSETARWAAVTARDEAAEGYFFYCVKTTKIYCRPTCKARLARRANVEFFDTGDEALAAGYRACKRCKPELFKYVPEADQMIERTRNILENLPEESPLPKLDEMAAQAGLTKYHFHRQFKRATGLTPREYALSRRRSRQNGVSVLDLNRESAIHTPSLLSDTATSSISSGTPDALQTPDVGMNDWLFSGLDDPIIFDDYTYSSGSTNENINTMIPAPVQVDFIKDQASGDRTMLSIQYSAVETTHGVLTMAFDKEQVCKLELVGSQYEAVASLASSFPAPFYLLVPVDELSFEHKFPIHQQILAIVQALENPTASLSKQPAVLLPSPSTGS